MRQACPRQAVEGGDFVGEAAGRELGCFPEVSQRAITARAMKFELREQVSTNRIPVQQVSREFFHDSRSVINASLPAGILEKIYVEIRIFFLTVSIVGKKMSNVNLVALFLIDSGRCQL